eukprot:gnl/TRDRNA2_/TRDRNA2_185368_c0_seq1.p1 gnl/TRDRNA2_/TRDRNA2_185368_c0~~gnl/TRDRNA2_/TRDRNA2_185368_c0_seq1.p1  ORF type:complete len:336 (+),score=76.08 gnl/TRDRNA2_/TRDRNA2_185368_c0_seq1:75-1082(+)
MLAVNGNEQDGKNGNAGYFHLRHVIVRELLEDETLGLLLHGTSIVGFCSSRAEDAGWRISDQIVEVNGHRVTNFEEFLRRFGDAQSEGLPIDFSVLRREDPTEAGAAEDELEGLFSGTNLFDLAGQLHRLKSVERKPEAQNNGADGNDAETCEMKKGNEVTDNPYIQALRRRRDELLRTADYWSDGPAESSLASRMATQRDALATLDAGSPMRPGCGGLDSGSDSALPWECCAPSRGCGTREAMHDFLQTPRPDTFASTGAGSQSHQQWNPMPVWSKDGTNQLDWTAITAADEDDEDDADSASVPELVKKGQPPVVKTPAPPPQSRNFASRLLPS